MMQRISPLLARALIAALLLLTPAVAPSLAQTAADLQGAPETVPPLTSRELSDIETQARRILTTGTLERNQVMAILVDRDNTDVVPALIQSLRFMRQDPWTIANALQALTGEELGNNWHEWVLWQEDHPEIKPFEGFAEYKAWAYSQIDPNFRLFLHDGVAHDIRLEEIVWGGVRKDGIPALVNPKLIAPEAALYLTPEELVFGVKINGDVRAYPLRILDWHEMFNDVVGGVPVALAYCTLCGSGILYETTVEGRDKPFEFGSSGFLYRSNKLMYDRETNSLWNQFTGAPVVGALTGSGIELQTRPVAITTWQNWFAKHPDTKVLSLETGYTRDYTPGRPYGEYFASPRTMFPVQVTLLLTPTSFGSEKARDDFFVGRRDLLVSEVERASAKIRKNCLPDSKADCDDDIEELEQALSKKLMIVDSQRASAEITVATEPADQMSSAANASGGPAGDPDQSSVLPNTAVASGTSNPTATQSVTATPSASPEPAPPVADTNAADTPVQTAARPDAMAPAVSPEPAPPVAPATSPSPDTAELLSYWRLRDEILRKSISKAHLSTSSGGWTITKFRVVSAVPDDSDRELVTLATAYTIERTSLADAGTSRSRDPIRFEQSLMVNVDTEEVVSVGKVKKVE